MCTQQSWTQCDSEKRSHKQLFLPAQTDHYSVSKDKPFPFVSVRPIHQHRRVKATQGTREETLNTTNATWCPAKTLFLILLSLGGVWHSKILKTHGHTSQSGCSDSCLICLLAVGTCYRQWKYIIYSVWFQGLRSAHACTHPLSRDREETADKSHKPKVLNSL